MAEENEQGQNNEVDSQQADTEANQDDAAQQDDEQAEIAKLTEKQKKAWQKSMKRRFRKIKRKAPYRFYPHTTKEEDQVVKAMKKIDYNDWLDFKTTMIARKQAFFSKAASAIAPAIPWILLAGLIILVVLLIVALLVSIFGGLSSGGGMSSEYGITGESFYGARVIYKDDEQAQADILSDLDSILGEISAKVEEKNSLVTITLTLPEDYDYLTFSSDAFSAEYADAYQIMFNLTKLIAEHDLVDDETIGSTIEENLELIKYFGYNSTLTSSMAETISNYINNNNLYKVDLDDDEVSTSEIESLITSAAQSILSEARYQIRTEKLYVKDYILSDETHMEDIPKENYVAMIFMPSSSVTFTYFSFMFIDIDFDTFTMQIFNGDTEISLSGMEWTTVDEGAEYDSWLYESDSDLSVSVSAFTDIDTSNLEALSSGMSLLEIVTSGLDYSIYLTELDSDEVLTDDTVLTIKMDGVRVLFFSDSAFYFAEYETTVE